MGFLWTMSRDFPGSKEEVEIMASKFLFSFYQLVFLFSLVFIMEKTFANGQNTTTNPTSQPKGNITTPTSHPSSTTIKPTSQSSTVAPTNQTTVSPTPSNHTYTPLPSNHSTPLPTTSLPSNTSTIPTPGPTGHSRDCHTCEDKLDKERHYKWVAVAFDFIFAIAFVIMLILYLRQKKMYREMEGDGSLSRLI